MGTMFERLAVAAVAAVDAVDAATGARGGESGATQGRLAPGLPLPAPMPADASGGGRGLLTGVFIIGRELHPLELRRNRHRQGGGDPVAASKCNRIGVRP